MLPIAILVRLADQFRVDAFGVLGTVVPAVRGVFLVRAEIKISVQEWLKRIPDFAIKAGQRPRCVSGRNGVLALSLQWSVM